MQIATNVSFYFKNDICKKFDEQNPLFWEDERSQIETNITFNRTHISHLEIFTDIGVGDGMRNGESNRLHLATCYNPSMLTKSLEPSKSHNWCATAQSYREILEEKEVVLPIDIGICPGNMAAKWMRCKICN